MPGRVGRRPFRPPRAALRDDVRPPLERPPVARPRLPGGRAVEELRTNMPADDASPVGPLEDFGPNVGLVEEIYRQWLEDPSSVSESWQDFFADYKPRLPAASGGNGETAVDEPPAVETPKPAAPPPPSAPAPAPDGATPLRGAAASIVKNMEASLGVPTATSARVVPAGLLE